MWPFPSVLNRWYDDALYRIEAELGQHPKGNAIPHLG
jgi:hypothetical protein